VTPITPFSSRCRTCGREIAPEVASCPHCGAANLEERCPHCNAVTTSSPDKELRFHCDLCGGPRVPRLDPKLRKSKRDVPFLKRAEEARKARAKYRAITAVFGVLGVGTTGLAGLFALIFGLSVGLGVTWALFAGTALFMILWSIGRAGAKTKEIAPAIDQAWMRAGADVAAALKGPFTAEKLAKAMGLDEAAAEELLAQLDANDMIRSDVTEAGEIAYQTKLRFGDAGTAGTPEEQEAEALAEAEAIVAAARAKASK
jgi:hypothetical protein